ncbi:MAG: glycerophosphoryl diester phosphodiesterase membrane domain-containing protein [Chloroflexi bacterium]|nr:glycerophosphoryl diester phosphodiesterase membrane domain-containing protein [Chloroflexota bacterium]
MAERRQSQAPMSLNEILRATFRIYGSRFMLFFGIVFAMELSIVVLETALGIGVKRGGGVRLFALAIGLLFPVLANVFQQGATIVAAAQVYTGGSPTFNLSYDTTFVKLGAIIVALVMVLLAVGLMMATLIGIPAGIYFGVGWFFTVQVILLEDLAFGRALARSYQLVKGNWWRVLGIIIVLGLIVTIPTALLTGASGTAASSTSRFDPTIASASAFGAAFLNAVVTAIFLPIGWIGATVLYLDLRRRKETDVASS